MVNMSRYTTAILLLIIFAIVLPNALASSGKDKIELKKAGHYLKKLGYSDAMIIGEPLLHRVSFYADTKFVAITPGFDFAPHFAHSEGNEKRYLMFDENTIEIYMPGFKKGLDWAKFEKVSLPELDNYKEYDIVVYRIKSE